MRAGEERSEDVPSDPLQPVPQDQRQARRHQQRLGAPSKVRVDFAFSRLQTGDLECFLASEYCRLIRCFSKEIME